jgi:ADP-ribose pyrophosphatase YjhB (NUDIX family)
MGPPHRNAADPSVSEPTLPRPIRRLLHVYWRFSRGLTLGVRAAVLDAEDRVFLVRHTYVRGWHLPGGGVEPCETALDALARELREEGCIEVTGAPHLHGVFFNGHVSDRDHVLLYVVRDFRVTAPKAHDREIAEAGFFPLRSLPEGVTAATRARLDDVVHGRPPALLW